ncbi:hypothetical protein CLV58_12435 [Spirosoma oryzae]|uniref:Uncharacterized protein n=1 Tax=Spirosoma oryzae TaxID=1469603 RepID=A0A2T0SAG2_9BACT|nr:hypothetical protein [Spirosoma oryzae]PRY30414.1 hypothetical protein CLV58_12435 [Spirosoma oryzae]
MKIAHSVQAPAYWTPDLGLIEAMTGLFDSMSLADLDKATLMNRTDTKYLLPARELPDLLDALREEYRWLEVDGVHL